jgi:hypothetical protein
LYSILDNLIKNEFGVALYRELEYDVTNISDILDAIYRQGLILSILKPYSTRRLLYCSLSQYGLG